MEYDNYYTFYMSVYCWLLLNFYYIMKGLPIRVNKHFKNVDLVFPSILKDKKNVEI